MNPEAHAAANGKRRVPSRDSGCRPTASRWPTRALAAAALFIALASLAALAPLAALAELAAPAPLAALAELAAPAERAVARGDRTSHLSSGDSASEFWDIVAHFESGHHLFARFMLTNEGPGERTAIATWQLIDPNGTRTQFHNGRRQQRWTLSPKGDDIRIGSSIFDQSGPMHRLEYDSTKRGIRVALQYAPRGPVAWTEPEAAGPYPTDLLELATPVSGTLWLAGMSEAVSTLGTISLSHTWMESSEADLALRRIDFASTGSESDVYLSDRTAPSGERVRWLVVASAGKVLYQTTSFALELLPSADQKGGDYPPIAELKIDGPGIEGAISRESTLAEADPLEEIPQPFRFLLSLRARPHRIWARASFEVRLRAGTDSPEIVLKGTGVTTITFTNPLPPTVTRGFETRIPGA